MLAGDQTLRRCNYRISKGLQFFAKGSLGAHRRAALAEPRKMLSLDVPKLRRCQNRVAETGPGGQARIRFFSRGGFVVGQVVLRSLSLLHRRRAAQSLPVSQNDSIMVI